MKIRFLLATASLLMAFGAHAAGKQLTLSMYSYGPIEFGKPLSEIEKLVGEKATLEEELTEGCTYGSFKKYPHITFMVERGIVTRADIDSSEVGTAYGIRIGSSKQEVRDAIPSIQESPHEYTEGHYLTSKSADGKNAIVFEENDNIVDYIRAGVTPSAEYIEGCL